MKVRFIIHLDIDDIIESEGLGTPSKWPTIHEGNFKKTIEIGEYIEGGSLYEAFFDGKEGEFKPIREKCKNISEGMINNITEKLNSSSFPNI